MIINRIYEWAHVQPNKPALICNDVTISYGVFAQTIERLRRLSKQKNLPAGQTAIVLAQDFADAWALVLALRSLGLDTATVSSIEHAEALGLRNVACVAMTEAERADYDAAGNSLGRVEAIAIPGPIVGHHEGELPRPPEQSPFGGHILFTSGTTGTYKKVLQQGANEERRNALRAKQLFFDRNTVAHFHAMPLWTGAGFKCPAAVWHVGGCAILDQTPNLVDNFFKHKLTHAFLVPPTLNSLCETYGRTRAFPADRIEFAIMGGFIPFKLVEQVIDNSNAKLTFQYSSTETGGIVMYTEFKTKDDLYWYTPVSDRKIEIVDDFGDECATGREGKLRIPITDLDCSAYLDDEEASAHFFRDGFFYPGDMAVARADGRIRILGRTDDVVLMQGMKVAVAPIEEAIKNQLGVDEVCVFSALDDQGIEELVIAIQSNRALPEAKLIEAAREFVSFERVRFAILKKFPRAKSGMQKIQRSVLKNFVFHEIGNPVAISGTIKKSSGQ